MTTRTRIFDVIAVNGGRVCSTLSVTVEKPEDYGHAERVVGSSRIAFYEECFGPVVVRERDEYVPVSAPPVLYWGRKGGQKLMVKGGGR